MTSISFAVDDVASAIVNNSRLISSTQLREVFIQAKTAHSTEKMESSGLTESDTRKWINNNGVPWILFGERLQPLLITIHLLLNQTIFSNLFSKDGPQHVDKHSEELRKKFVLDRAKRLSEFIETNLLKVAQTMIGQERLKNSVLKSSSSNTTPGLYNLVTGSKQLTLGLIKSL